MLMNAYPHFYPLHLCVQGGKLPASHIFVAQYNVSLKQLIELVEQRAHRLQTTATEAAKPNADPSSFCAGCTARLPASIADVQHLLPPPIEEEQRDDSAVVSDTEQQSAPSKGEKAAAPTLAAAPALCGIVEMQPPTSTAIGAAAAPSAGASAVPSAPAGTSAGTSAAAVAALVTAAEAPKPVAPMVPLEARVELLRRGTVICCGCGAGYHSSCAMRSNNMPGLQQVLALAAIGRPLLVRPPPPTPPPVPVLTVSATPPAAALQAPALPEPSTAQLVVQEQAQQHVPMAAVGKAQPSGEAAAPIAGEGLQSLVGQAELEAEPAANAATPQAQPGIDLSPVTEPVAASSMDVTMADASGQAQPAAEAQPQRERAVQAEPEPPTDGDEAVQVKLDEATAQPQQQHQLALVAAAPDQPQQMQQVAPAPAAEGPDPALQWYCQQCYKVRGGSRWKRCSKRSAVVLEELDEEAIAAAAAAAAEAKRLQASPVLLEGRVTRRRLQNAIEEQDAAQGGVHGEGGDGAHNECVHACAIHGAGTVRFAAGTAGGDAGSMQAMHIDSGAAATGPSGQGNVGGTSAGGTGGDADAGRAADGGEGAAAGSVHVSATGRIQMAMPVAPRASQARVDRYAARNKNKHRRLFDGEAGCLQVRPHISL